MLAQNPDTKTVGLLYSKSEDSSKQPIEDAKAYLEEQGKRHPLRGKDRHYHR